MSQVPKHPRLVRALIFGCLAWFGTLASAQQGDEPYIVVLGTAQDGGLPQIGCQGPHCQRARSDRGFARLVTSLLIAEPETGQRWLVEATPDIREQMVRADGHPATRKPVVGRGPLVDGIFLTHAHLGHYTGLLHLGREAYGHPEVPVFASSRMAAFLRNNGPWKLLIEAGHMLPAALKPGQTQELGKRLSVTPFLVPHREEFSDTFGYLIAGPNAKVLFIPDIDKWTKWGTAIEERIKTVDIALLDGTFFADGEIPGRAMADIPHPFIAESLKRFAALPALERSKIHFIHFNHTNPVVDPKSEAAAKVKSLGMHLARDGQIISL